MQDIIRYVTQINIGGGHQLEAQPSHTQSEPAPAKAAAAAPAEDADMQSSCPSDAQADDAPDLETSNKKRKVFLEGVAGRRTQDYGDDGDDVVSLLQEGKCC